MYCPLAVEKGKLRKVYFYKEQLKVDPVGKKQNLECRRCLWCICNTQLDVYESMISSKVYASPKRRRRRDRHQPPLRMKWMCFLLCID